MLEKLTKVRNRTSKTDAASEIRRCFRDPAYFIRNYVYIKSKDYGNCKFNLWPFQEKILREFENHNKNIILKARQLGITELLAAYILWYILFHPDKTVVVVSKTRQSASDIIDRIKYGYKYLVDWLKIAKPTTDNVFSLKFDNDSVVMAESTTENAARGIACSLFFVDEAAFIDCFEEMWASILPTLGENGKCIVSSTPATAAGMYYDLFQGAPGNGLNKILIPWDSDPRRDQEWFDKNLTLLGRRRFYTEYMCSFSLSGDTVIDAEDIERHAANVIDPLDKIGPLRGIWIWKTFDPDCRYSIAGDTSRGDGEDYSAAVVLNVETREIVCEFKGKVKTNKFAEILVLLGNMYGDALLIIENNSYGLAVLTKLIELEYPNLYWEDRQTKTFTGGSVDFDVDDIIPGFNTNVQTRIQLIDILEESFRLDKIKVYSERILVEVRDFVYENGKPKARKGRNDDLMMSIALVLHVSSYVFSDYTKEKELTNKLLYNIKTQNNTINMKVPGEIGFSEENNVYLPNKISPYQIKHNNLTFDFSNLHGKSQNPKKELKNTGIIFLGTIR